MIVPTGQTLIIPSPIRLENNGRIIVDGTLTVNVGGHLVNNGQMDHNGNNTLNIIGTFENNDIMINTGTVNVASTGKIVNADNGNLINHGILHNYGYIDNNETVENHGMINNHAGAKIVNTGDGQITVHANAIFTNHVDGEIHNQPGADIIINRGGHMSNRSESGDFNNQGTIQNSGNVHGENDGNVIVKSAFPPPASITLDAIATATSANTWSMNSNATLTPDQKLNISAGQTLIIAASQVLLNHGTITSQGTIINNGTINNIASRGSVSQQPDGTMFGYNYVNLQSGHMYSSGDIINNGTMNNSEDPYLTFIGTLFMSGGGIYNYGGKITNSSTGTINLKLNGGLNNYGTSYENNFNNAGAIINEGSIWNGESIFNNTGTIVSRSFTYNRGNQTVMYGGDVNNTSDILNNDGGNITMNNGAIFVNQAIGRVRNKSGGIIVINAGGTMTIAGTYYNDAGSTLANVVGGTINNKQPVDVSTFIVSPNSVYTPGTINGNPAVREEPNPAPGW